MARNEISPLITSCSLLSHWIVSDSLALVPGSSVHGISQARILEWVAISFSKVRSHWPRDQACVSCIAGRFFTSDLPGKPDNILYWAPEEKERLFGCLTSCFALARTWQNNKPIGVLVPQTLSLIQDEWMPNFTDFPGNNTGSLLFPACPSSVLLLCF